MFRDPELIARTVAEFGAADYRVEAQLVAVPPAFSRLSAEARFVQQVPRRRRWTSLQAHDTAVLGIPATLAAIEAKVDRLVVRDRAGSPLYDTAAGAHGGARPLSRWPCAAAT